MSTDTSTPILDRRAEAGPAPDTIVGPKAGDRYLDTVRVLGAQAQTLHAALRAAKQATDGQARTAALYDLHRRLRAMAGHANHALGGWADPPEPT